MKNIIIVGLLPVLGALTACSVDDEQTAERVPISLSGTTLTLTETRAAAASDLNNGYIESGQTVMVRVRNTGSTGNWTDYAYTTGTNGVLTPPTIPPFYPLDGTHVDVVAYCPAAVGSTFSVQSDQTTPESYLASDLLYASVSNQAKSTTAVPLQFEHKMAKVVVSVTAGAGVSTIEEVTLHQVLPSVPFNFTTGDIGTALGSPTSIAVVKANTTTTAIGTAVFPGQVIDGDLLTVKTNLGTATYSVNSKVFSSGKVYNLSVSVNRAAVGATTQITGWTDTASASVNKEEASKTFTMVNSQGGHFSFNMIRVEGGPYTTLAGRDVTGTLSSFYIGQFEVSNFMWWMIMGETPANQVEGGNCYPVGNVSWNDCNNYITQLNALLADQLDGMTFKLPTEAQWEYAARGGVNQERFTFSGSNNLDLVGVSSTYNNGKPKPCGYRYANSLGIFDMTGNVWEWCLDNYQAASAIPANLGNDYISPATGNGYVVIRGGGFKNNGTTLGNNYEGTAQVNYFSLSGGRWCQTVNDKVQTVGFRLVLQ